MRQTIKHIFVVAVAFALFTLGACNEDKGNYTYTDINRVDSILGIEDSYNVFIGYQLQITPRLYYSLGSEGDAFTYKWYYYANNVWNLLQEGLSLDQEIAGVIGRNRTLAFEAMNTATEVAYRKLFTIVLTDPAGFVALVEKEDGYDVDMVTYLSLDTAFALSKDVLEGVESEIPRAGVKPYDIVATGGTNNLSPLPSAPDGKNYQVYILTDQYTTRLTTDFSWLPEYNIETTIEGGSYLDVNYVQKGKPVTPVKLRITDNGGRKHWFYHVDENGQGNWFLYQTYNLLRFICNPMNMLGETGDLGYIWAKEGTRYEPSSEIYVNGQLGATFWDKDHKRFMFAVPTTFVSPYTFGNAFYSKPIDTETGTGAFSFTDPDYDDVISMGEKFTSATVMNGFAIIKLKSGGYSYIQYAGQNAPTTPAAGTARLRRSDFAASSPIGSAKFVCAYPQSDVPFIYYVSNNRVYKADISNTAAQETEITSLFISGGYSEITAFEFLLPNTNGAAVFHISDIEKALAVATYNPSLPKNESGKLEVFTLVSGSSNGSLELAKYPTDAAIAEKPTLADRQIPLSFTGLGKVVGLDYKKK